MSNALRFSASQLPKSIFKHQFTQFLLVGALNAIIDLGFLNIALYLWPTTNQNLLILFNTIAYLLAILNSYIWNSRFAFRRQARKDLREKSYFLIQAVVSLIISNTVFLGGIYVLTFSDLSFWLVQNLSKLVAMITPSIFSFIFMKYFVFRKTKTQ